MNLDLTLLSTYCIGCMMTGSLKGQKKSVHTSGSKFCSLNCMALVRHYQPSLIGSFLMSEPPTSVVGGKYVTHYSAEPPLLGLEDCRLFNV